MESLALDPTAALLPDSQPPSGAAAAMRSWARGDSPVTRYLPR
jgi:hypothetical protein